ncbi:HNH endonuclease [Vibrio fluvialis]|nr:HNH endonuclease [Vibrio fluvialis]
MARLVITEEMKLWLTDKYQTLTVAEMVPLFNEKFGTDRTYQQLKDNLAYYGIKSSKPNRGQKNVDKRRVSPIGSERKSGDGYIEVKIAEPDVWETKQRAVWRSNFGEIPDGHFVRMKNGNRKDCSPENLYLVDKRTNALLNKKYCVNNQHQQVRESIILIAKIETKTARIEESI